MDATTELFALLQAHVASAQPMDTLLAEIDRVLDAGADLHATDTFDRRPLQLACWQPSPRLLEHLIARGADVADLNRLDRQGNAPLHRRLRREDHARLFLRLGADVNVLNHLQQTPIGVAQRAIRERRWVMEHLGGSSPDRDQALLADLERTITVLREAGGRDRREGWKAVIDEDAARDVGPKDPGLALAGYPVDSLEELALWMKEHEVSPGEITSLLRVDPTARTIDGQGHPGALAFFHHGDLHVQGNLHAASAFVVTGDLTVEGVLSDAGPDSCLLVGGSVTAHAIHTDGDIRVAGDVAATVVYGSYNDQVLEAQTLRCKALITNDHTFRAERVCEVVVDLRDDYDPLACARTFTPQVFEVGGDLSITKLFDRLYAGEDVFASEGEEPDAPPVLPFEQFEAWLAAQNVNQRTKLALIKEHWTPTLRAADPAVVKRTLSRALKSPKLKADLQAYLASL